MRTDNLLEFIEITSKSEISIMKTATFIFAVIAVVLAGCKSSRAATLDNRRAENFVVVILRRSRLRPQRQHLYQATNDYLDTWCGSADEEKGLRQRRCSALLNQSNMTDFDQKLIERPAKLPPFGTIATLMF